MCHSVCLCMKDIFLFFQREFLQFFFTPKEFFFQTFHLLKLSFIPNATRWDPNWAMTTALWEQSVPAICHLWSMLTKTGPTLLIHSCELSHFKMLYFDNCWETSVHLLILERNESRQGLPAEYSQFLPSVFHHAVVMLQTSQRTLVSIKHGLCLNGSWIYFPDGNSIHKWLHTFYLSLLKEAVMSNWND